MKKRIADFVRLMMKESNVSIKDAAECIGCSVGTFRNKLTQDRFSLENLIILSELCDYTLSFVPANLCNPFEDLTVDKYIDDPNVRELLDKHEQYRLKHGVELLRSYVQKDCKKEESQKFFELLDEIEDLTKK